MLHSLTRTVHVFYYCVADVAVCGTSANPCSDTYSGPGAASEVETQMMVSEVKSLQADAGGIQLFISMHSYAQFWLIPWGGTQIKPADYDDLVSVTLTTGYIATGATVVSCACSR